MQPFNLSIRQWLIHLVPCNCGLSLNSQIAEILTSRRPWSDVSGPSRRVRITAIAVLLVVVHGEIGLAHEENDMPQLDCGYKQKSKSSTTAQTTNTHSYLHI